MAIWLAVSAADKEEVDVEAMARLVPRLAQRLVLPAVVDSCRIRGVAAWVVHVRRMAWGDDGEGVTKAIAPHREDVRRAEAVAAAAALTANQRADMGNFMGGDEEDGAGSGRGDR